MRVHQPDDDAILEALHASEQRYHRLFESAKDGILILDAETGIVVDVNPFLVELLGIPRETFLDRRIWELGFFRNIVANEDRFYEFRAQEYIRYEQVPLESFDGQSIAVEFVSNVYPVSGHRMIQCHFHDITERRRTVEAQRSSQQILEEIIDAIPVRVFWKDKNLVYLGCNAVFAHDAGFADPKDLIGKDDYQMAWRDQSELYRSDDRHVIESGRPRYLIEEPQTTPEGNTITLLTSKIPLRSSTGEIVGIIGTYMDITERKQAEQALYNSENRFREIANHAQEWIWEIDIEGRYIYSNPTVEKLLGYSPEEILQMHFYELFHPDDIESLKASSLAAFATRESFHSFVNRTVHKNGRTVWFETSGFPIFDETGRWLGYRGIDTDITERKKASEDRERLIAELKNTLAEVKTLKGFIPICASCKNIRNDEGFWGQVESYITQHTGAQFSHAICPDCIKKLYPEYNALDDAPEAFPT